MEYEPNKKKMKKKKKKKHQQQMMMMMMMKIDSEWNDEVEEYKYRTKKKPQRASIREWERIVYPGQFISTKQI